MSTATRPPLVPHAKDVEVTPALVEEHGLSTEEYGKITAILEREASYTELGLFSALWSEHCGYKNSKPLLRRFPTEAPWVLQGPGENAGVIDIGDGWAVAFKIESHNHPSAVEPYQGAATGVGGILRDVFTMGARPIAVLDALRFGPLSSPRVRYLFAGVVKGIGDYGNCVGIPNIGGETWFDDAYEGNPLVNAMAIGLMRKEELIRATASGPGNPILAVGARTGRDGIHGATFASEELSEETEASRPQVQVGDPFTEKLLLEASLELIRSGHIVGIQDMGAAGLASASSEMAARAGTGVEIDTAKVPVREEGMTPYEILLSESQERMVVVAKAGHEDDVVRILEKWELEAAVIGQVTDDGRYRVMEGDHVVADIPGTALVECPTYTREGVEAPDVTRAREWDPAQIAGEMARDSDSALQALRSLLAAPNIASKAWVHEQYDSTVRTNTVQPPGGDAGVLRIRGTKRGIAATVDCNARYVYLDPRKGGKIAVAEAARNLVCVGARPRAVTDNLNFGNPHKPEVYHQMKESTEGMAEACERLETPVTGGNVSLYNENPRGAIFPTPVVGMVGVLDDVSKTIGAGFRAPGDAIVLLGRNTAEIGASEYLKTVHGKTAGAVPDVDLDAEKALHEAVLAMVDAELLSSAHDCAEGGLAVCIAESAIGARGGAHGARVTLEDEVPVAALLFGEAQGRIVASCDPSALDRVLALAREHGVPVARIGTVGAAAEALAFELVASGVTVEAGIEELAETYATAIPRLMDAPPSAGG